MRNGRCADRATRRPPAALLRVPVRASQPPRARAHRLAVRRRVYHRPRSACAGRGPQPPATTRCPLSALATVVRAPRHPGNARLSHVEARAAHRAGQRVNAAPKLSVVVAVQQAQANPMDAVTEVAADNAMYRRSLLLEPPDLLADGFWEPRFHARLRAAGHEIRLDPALIVTHRNCYRAGGFFGQRLAHGRQFGHARAATWSRVRLLAMLLAAPLLPLAFLRKFVRAARRHPVCSPHVLPALGWLLVFVSAWGMGEAMGYWTALQRGNAK